VQIQILKSIQDEGNLRDQWDNLVLKMEVPQVFFTYEWALAVERAFRSSVEPWIFTFGKNDQLIGVAALASVPAEHKKLFFLGSSTGDYCDIVSAPEDRNDVVIALLAALGKHQVREIALANIPEESGTIGALSQSRSSGYWLLSRPAYVCSRIVLTQKRVTNQHGEARDLLPRPVKDEKLRRMSRLGPVTLTRLSSREDAASVLNAVVKAQISRFLATSRLSPLLTVERRNFLAELTNLLSERNWLDVEALRIAERDVAWNFGFLFQGVVFWYLPTFDISLDSLSPGACLLRLMTEEFCKHPEISEIDLGLGDEGYKERVANASRRTLELTLSSNLAIHGEIALTRVLARGVKAWEPMEHMVRYFLRTATRVKTAILNKHVLKGIKALLERAARKIFNRNEVLFFEWNGNSNSALRILPPGFTFAEITWDILAETALQRRDDPDTLEYLKRAARRLRNSKGQNPRGYVLVSDTGQALHYCWATEFAGFQLSEIQHKLKPVADAVMIFDCWTPHALRGMHYYRTAVECLAEELRRNGKTAWIFSALRNLPSSHALQNSRFECRYSLLRRKFVYRMPIVKLGNAKA
jgi:CelD/BcsL family acetyltransferase involved in cellulose biosynthesis